MALLHFRNQCGDFPSAGLFTKTEEGTGFDIVKGGLWLQQRGE